MLRSLIAGMRDAGSLDPPVSEMLDLVWSHSTWLPEPPPSEPGRLRHNMETPLLDQLAETVNWEVNEAIVYAPFHDPACRAISDIIGRFHPGRLRVLISRGTSVDADRLHDILAATQGASCTLIEVRDEPTTYLHAKWIHLIGASHEALLTGSSNLSVSALLLPSPRGNIELGLINVGNRGDFDSVYAPLTMVDIGHPRDAGVTIRIDDEPKEDVAGPVLLWSQLDGTTLTLVFDRPLNPGFHLRLANPDGPITVAKITIHVDRLLISIDPREAGTIAERGLIEVHIDDDPQYPALLAISALGIAGKVGPYTEP